AISACFRARMRSNPPGGWRTRFSTGARPCTSTTRTPGARPRQRASSRPRVGRTRRLPASRPEGALGVSQGFQRTRVRALRIVAGMFGFGFRALGRVDVGFGALQLRTQLAQALADLLDVLSRGVDGAGALGELGGSGFGGLLRLVEAALGGLALLPRALRGA